MGVLKVGLVGCGKIADANHMPEMLSLGKNAEVTAMFDTKKGKAEALAEKHKLKPKFCNSLDELLKSDVDAVIIATPNLYHYEQTLQCLNAGKHVLVEKPMASSVAEADEMIDLAERKGLILQVNQSLRFSALYKKLAELVAAGEIGKPLHARCLRAATSSPDVGWSPGATWFVQKKYKGSLVTDIAVHMADLLQWCFGPVDTVMSQTTNLTHEVPDNVVALFRYKNGATATLELSWTFPIGGNKFEVYGRDGAILMTNDSFEIHKKGRKKPKVIKFASIKAVPNSHAVFAASIAKGGDENWKVGREALALCMAIIESNQEQKAVEPKMRKTTSKTSVKSPAAKKAIPAAKKSTPVKAVTAKAAPKAPAKKAAPVKAAPVKKAEPVKKAAPAKAAPVKKAAAPKAAAKNVPAKNAAPVQKDVPAKKAAPVKAAPVKKAEPVKKAAPAKKAAPVKAVPAKKVVPAKKAAPVKAAPVKKAVPAKKAAKKK